MTLRIETIAADTLGSALAARVAGDLKAAITRQGLARLAVPGGSTPGPFLRSLGATDLPWEKVTVTLTDERWVPTDNERSNQRAVEETLFAGAARRARFVPLYNGPGDPDQTLPDVRDALPLDICVLGMGNDMHTASLFPGSPELPRALSPDDGAAVMAVTAPGAPEPRVTLTAPVLAAAPRLYLLIKGTDKRAALDRAMATDDPLIAPIRAVLAAAAAPVVFYADHAH